MRDDLDNLIDRALADYSAAEPLAGLEDRVLQRVRSAETARRRGWWVVLAFAASALAILALTLPSKPQPPQVVAVVAPPPPPAPPLDAPAPKAVAHAPRPHRSAPRAQPAPKQPLFPMPAPLTREERLLVQMAQSRPEMLTARPVNEIEINPIQIAPLQLGGAQ